MDSVSHMADAVTNAVVTQDWGGHTVMAKQTSRGGASTGDKG